MIFADLLGFLFGFVITIAAFVASGYCKPRWKFWLLGCPMPVSLAMGCLVAPWSLAMPMLEVGWGIRLLVGLFSVCGSLVAYLTVLLVDFNWFMRHS